MDIMASIMAAWAEIPSCCEIMSLDYLTFIAHMCHIPSGIAMRKSSFIITVFRLSNIWFDLNGSKNSSTLYIMLLDIKIILAFLILSIRFLNCVVMYYIYDTYVMEAFLSFNLTQ